MVDYLPRILSMSVANGNTIEGYGGLSVAFRSGQELVQVKLHNVAYYVDGREH